MAELVWDEIGERLYETGTDKAVLYIPGDGGVYDNGVAWNGVTAVTQRPTGAEANAQYADNIKYLNLMSVEEFEATMEAFTYPDEFAQFDGYAQPEQGVYVGQQSRKPFGLAYRTLLGNDLLGNDYGYKLHLIYGVTASPSEKAHQTVNETPEPLTLSWELTTQPVPVPGRKPTAHIAIDSTRVNPTSLAALEKALYGQVGTDPRLPLPAEVIGMFAGDVQEVTPLAPTFNDTDTITIPTVAGVRYTVKGLTVTAGPLVIEEDTVVVAYPTAGYSFPDIVDNDWFFKYDG